jgi:hypothetical protein
VKENDQNDACEEAEKNSLDHSTDKFLNMIFMKIILMH